MDEGDDLALFGMRVAACRAALGSSPSGSAATVGWTPSGPTADRPPGPALDDAPTCLMFSPHPDDEALVGGLGLRLRWVHGWRVVNVAVTLGSRLERRAARWEEAQAACARLGFELVSPVGRPGQALERITPLATRREPVHWSEAVHRAATLIRHWQPRVIQAPHALDGHDAHIGTHRLVRDALSACGDSVRAEVVWSEYWNTQLKPGLMVELSDAEVVRLMAATALHAGEVSRHPYHLLLPAWLADSARRGAERVGRPGAPGQPITFAALYGWHHWDGKRLRRRPPCIVNRDGDLAALLTAGAKEQRRTAARHRVGAARRAR